MDLQVTESSEIKKDWEGGVKPLKASYGKLMMWFFIVSDALTFSGFLASYGFTRFKHITTWPIADEVFNHFPFLHGLEAPMYYVALMTFILIFSSVTMVLAVDAGHHLNKKKVSFYMLLTILGGLIFLGSQAWEWKTFIVGQYGAVETRGGQILQFVDAQSGKRAYIDDFAQEIPYNRRSHENNQGVWFKQQSVDDITLEELKAGFKQNDDILIRTELVVDNKKQLLNRQESLAKMDDAVRVVRGANLVRNEYGNRLFANYFFFITGFHGFHVFSGVVINIIIFINILLGTYQKRGHYEMVEKVGLYWHFVDLVWVFVFTFFYLV